ncbi:DoxX family protein [Blastococcus sp. LR1]|uniref:DoxX family protein n=1 Tax=Blastococcus sp. LR1 TaxID=2877000 RepID=UPI001CCAEB36|nr:DoxX family protein [Blastococcus sp. LR1]MCA0145724.1 DoxX family protein [Blastococcus sp. LR1]
MLRLGLAAVFAGAGLAKLAGDAAMVEMFADIGAGQWLRYAVGSCELLAAGGLVLPRLAGPAACGLVGLMIGATLTNLFVLEVSAAVTLVLLAASAVVAWARWDDVRALSPVRGRRPAASASAVESPWS